MTPLLRFAIYITLVVSALQKPAAQTHPVALIDSLYWAGRFDEIIDYVDKAPMDDIDVYTEMGLIYHQANAYYRTNQFAEAWDLTFQNYHKIAQLTLNDSLSAQLAIDICQKLGDYAYIKEEYAIGVEALDRGISLQKEHLPNDHWRLVKLYHKSGAVYRIKNDYNTATDRLELGKALIPSLTKDLQSKILPVYQAEFAEIFNETHQPKKAIAIYKDMIAQAEEQGNLTRISIYNNNCGLAYERMSDYGKAKYHFEKGLKVKLEKSGENSIDAISGYTNMARIHAKHKDYSEAKLYHEKLSVLIPKLLKDDNIRLSDNYISYGLVYFNQKDYEQALAMCQKSEAIRRLHVGEDDLKLADAMQQSGMCLAKMGKHQEALIKLNEALIIREKGAIRQDYVLSSLHCNLYEVYHSLGNDEEAERMLSKAYTSIGYDSKVGDRFELLEIPSGLIEPLSLSLKELSYKMTSGTNDAFIGEGEELVRISEALITYLKYTFDDASSRKILAETIHPLYQSIIEFYHKVYLYNSDPQYIEKAFTLIERSNNTFLYEHIAENNNALTLPKDLIAKKEAYLQSIQELRSKISKMYEDNQSLDEEYAKTLNSLSNAKNNLYDLVENIQRDHPEYFNSVYNFPITSIDEVKKMLNQDEALVNYFFGLDHLFSIVIGRDKAAFNATEIGNINEDIVSLITAIRLRKDINQIVATSNKLYDKLIDLNDLEKFARLNIVADNTIGLLPFEVLHGSNKSDYPMLDKTTSYQYSATLMVLGDSKKSPKSKGSLVMAPVFEDNNSTYKQTIQFADNVRGDINSYLPESKNEATNIAQLFGSTLFLNNTASESNFKSLAPNQSFIHLATHGYVDKTNPTFSRLYFSANDTIDDGQLYTDEIIGMDLSADLVALSACNTGVGNIQSGEGIASLGRAFAYAGCPNQLLSLWSVNDKATTTLMTYYYQNLSNGVAKAEALQLAKKQYLQESPDVLKHPFYWAGFVYYGTDAPLKSGSGLPYMPLAILAGIGGLLYLGSRMKKKSAA